MKIKITLFEKSLFKHIYLQVFAILFLFSSAITSLHAQTETCIPIGLDKHELNFSPFAGQNTHSYVQQIFTAKELSENGIVAGDEIIGLSFNYFSEIPTKRPIIILLGNTNLNDLNDGWTPNTNLTQVLSSNCQEFSKGNDEWTNISFQNNFLYSGENIIIATLMNIEDALDPTCFTENNKDKRFYSHSSNKLDIFRYDKNNYDNPITFDETSGLPKNGENSISGNTLDKRNNIRFCKIGPICPKVNALTTIDITESSITLDWINGGLETSWTIEYGESGFTPGLGHTLETTTHPFKISNLKAMSSYDFYLRANCLDGEKSELTSLKNLNTACGVIDRNNYLEEFTKNSHSLQCWTIIDEDEKPDTLQYGKWSFTNNAAKYTYSKKKTPASDWLISPRLDVKQGMEFSFDYSTMSPSYKEKFSVYVITGDSPQDYSNAENIRLTEEVGNTNYLKIDPISLSDYENSQVYIAIKCESEADKSSLFIDNFRFYKRSSEKNITKFSFAEETKPATIDTENHKVEIEVSFLTPLSGLTPTIEISDYASISPNSASKQNFSTPLTYTITAEDQSTQDWTITVVNAETKSSEKEILSFSFSDLEGKAIFNNINNTIEAKIHWEKPLKKITPNIELSKFASISPAINLEQDFSKPVEYTITAEDGSQKVWTISILRTESPIGAHCDNPVILDLTQLSNTHVLENETTKGFGNIYEDTSLGAYDDGMDKIYKISVSEKSFYKIRLKTSTNFTSLTLFKGCPSEDIIIKKSTKTAAADQVLEDIVLHTNEEYFLMVDKRYGPKDIVTYNLIFERNENPPCISPNDLKASNILQTTASLNWTQAFKEEKWEIIYGIKDFNKDTEGNLISDIETTTYNLENLVQDTEYDVYIRSKCSETETAEWADAIKFKTLESCPTPTTIDISSITTNSAIISWNGYNANSWILEYKLSSETDYQSLYPAETTQSLINLISASEYNIRIKSKCGDNEESLNYAEKTFITKCENISALPYLENFENYGVNNPDAFPICWHRPVSFKAYDHEFPSIVENIDGTTKRYLKFRSEPSIQTIASTQIIDADLKDLSLDFILKTDTKNSGSMTIGLMSDPKNESTFTEITTITQADSQTKKHTVKFSDYDIETLNRAIAFKFTSKSEYIYYWLTTVNLRENFKGNDIITFSTEDLIDTVIINVQEHTIIGTISYNANLSEQTPTITISEGATISPESDKVQDFANSVTYKVTSENGNEQDWLVTLKKAETASTKNDILSIDFPNREGKVDINEKTRTVSAKINWQSPLTNIKPTIVVSNFATIIDNIHEPRDFTEDQIYIVKSQNETAVEWTISIKNAEAPQGANCENPISLNLSSLGGQHTILNETTNGFGNVYHGTSMENYDKGQDKIYKLTVNEKSVYNIKLNTSTTYVGIGIFEGCPSQNKLIDKDNSNQTAGVLNLKDIILRPNKEYFLMVDKFLHPDFIKSYNLTFSENKNPDCFSPTDINVSDISQTSVSLNWAQGFNENEWEIKYGERGFYVNQTGTLIVEDQAPNTQITGLSENKEYDIYLRSKCSADESSKWQGPIPIKTLAACPIPTELQLSLITENSVTVSWNGQSASKWILEYKKSSDSQYESIEIETNSHTLSQLSPSSTYKIRVKAKCAEIESEYSDEQTFKTNCSIISELPYYEGFEDYGFANSDAFPDCWYRPSTHKPSSTIFPSIVTLDKMPSRPLKFSSSPSNPTIAATPIVSPDLNTIILEFILKRDGTSAGIMTIGLMDDPENAETFTEVMTINPSDNEITKYKIDFASNSIAGTNKSIAFKHTSQTSYNSYWLDDITIRRKSADKEILEFTTPHLLTEVSINGNNIAGALNQDADITKLIPTIIISEGASISPASGIEQDFSNTVKYTVTAEDGSYQDWFVKLNKETSLSSEKEIISFKFAEQIGNSQIDSETVKATAMWNINLSSVIPQFELSEYATIPSLTNQAQDFSSPRIYTVKAQDGSTKDWTITITPEESPCLNAFATPFTETFATNSQSINCWTIIDNNKDGKDTGNGKWTILANEGYAEYKWSGDDNADDWLISPKIKLSEKPELNFKYKNAAASLVEKFSVYVIKEFPSNILNASNILETTTSKNSNWQELNNISLIDYQGQEIFIAIKCESEKNKNFLQIKDFTIKSEEEKFKIYSSAEGNGSINPNGETWVNKGNNMTFHLSPDSGYSLSKLFDNEIDKTSELIDNKYRLSNIKENHEILAKFIPVNSITEESSLDIKIYPTPTSDILNFEASVEISQIEIITIDGRTIDKQNVNNNTYQYQTSALAEGVYFAKIQTYNKTIIKQFQVKK